MPAASRCSARSTASSWACEIRPPGPRRARPGTGRPPGSPGRTRRRPRRRPDARGDRAPARSARARRRGARVPGRHPRGAAYGVGPAGGLRSLRAGDEARIGELRRRVAGIGGVEVPAGRDDRVDAVEQRRVEHDVGGAELALELLHRPRADDRRRDGAVFEREGDRQVDQRQSRPPRRARPAPRRRRACAGSRAATCRSATAAGRCACSAAASWPLR